MDLFVKCHLKLHIDTDIDIDARVGGGQMSCHGPTWCGTMRRFRFSLGLSLSVSLCVCLCL